MTLHATRDGQVITIHGNTGVDLKISNSKLDAVHITENAQHLDWFHKALGELLASAKAEREDNA